MPCKIVRWTEQTVTKPASGWKAHKFICFALVVELADTPDLGSGGEIHASSSLVRGMSILFGGGFSLTTER